MQNPETRFRLRWNEKIVGYARSMGSGFFFSKDEYAWNGQPIEYNLKDLHAGISDINRRQIYSEDILEFKTPSPEKYAYLLHDSILDQFQLLTADGEDLISANGILFLREHPFVWKSYRFIQNRL